MIIVVVPVAISLSLVPLIVIILVSARAIIAIIIFWPVPALRRIRIVAEASLPAGGIILVLSIGIVVTSLIMGTTIIFPGRTVVVVIVVMRTIVTAALVIATALGAPVVVIRPVFVVIRTTPRTEATGLVVTTLSVLL